ncbi:hypothetical protein ABZV75_09675 [Streptomyces flaveolus]|uniref:hypothetical protein n=1 Tax=Streptomyces flaveolus TaxID=67297 RepID=UPI0033A04552
MTAANPPLPARRGIFCGRSDSSCSRLEPNWACPTPAAAGAYRMTADVLAAVVRRVVRTASPARDEQHFRSTR